MTEVSVETCFTNLEVLLFSLKYAIDLEEPITDFLKKVELTLQKDACITLPFWRLQLHEFKGVVIACFLTFVWQSTIIIE